jgi:phenylacetate-coenzyme A ligase PaaK-like adenylate-forming protein
MWSSFDFWRSSALALDVLAAAQGTPEAVQRRQSRRLKALLEFARGLPLYRERLGRNGRVPPLSQVPPLTKRELMHRFDESVADRQLRLPALRRFMAEPSAIGREFAGRYTLWESSGSTGDPAVFVQDAQAMAVYDTLEALRRATPAGWQRWLDPWYLSDRFAFVGATGGHFASTVSIQRLRRANSTLARRLQGFSFLQPLPALCAQLQRFAPTVLVTYPTAALQLAEEVAAGRLQLQLREVWTGGEALTEGMRRAIERGFGCPANNSYGASEFLALASPCRLGVLHLNSDWAILESVDERMRPVPAGRQGCTTLLTNLANHVQPIIRYDIGDRVVLRPQPCACGSPLPAIEVQGRVDDTVVLQGEGGRAVRLLPLALTTVLEDDAGVYDFQIVQDGAHALRLSVAGEAAPDATKRARSALAAFLDRQGLSGVHIDAHSCPACERGRSGKVQRVVAAPVKEAETV